MWFKYHRKHRRRNVMPHEIERRKDSRDVDIIKTLVDIVYELDSERRITYLNHRSEEILDYNTHDIVGRKWSAFIENTKELHDYLDVVEEAKIEKSTHPITKVIPFRCKNGTTIMIELLEKIEYTETNNVKRYIGIARQITAKQTEIQQEKEIVENKIMMALDNAERRLRMIAQGLA